MYYIWSHYIYFSKTYHKTVYDMIYEILDYTHPIIVILA